jgi:hypothetical protein
MPRRNNYSPQNSILIHALLSISTMVFGTLRWKLAQHPKNHMNESIIGIGCTLSVRTHKAVGLVPCVGCFSIHIWAIGVTIQASRTLTNEMQAVIK